VRWRILVDALCSAAEWWDYWLIESYNILGGERCGWRWTLNTVGLWSDDSAGTDWGLEVVQHCECAISRTLGYELYGKWVGWLG
jgi:hypothetical protein